MGFFLRITLAVGLVLLGVPHLFCACPAAQTVEPANAASCSHCHDGQSDSAPQRSGPCQCRQCELVETVPSSPPVSVPLPSLFTCLCLTLDDQRVDPSPPCPSQIGGGAGPPGSSAGPSRPLPILLGHLLF